MTIALSELKNKLRLIFKSNRDLPLSKLKLKDNLPLNDQEFNLVCKICDIFASIAREAGNEVISPPLGGVFWQNAKPGMGPFELYARKNRQEINHLFLLYNAFRDFCALAYEFDKYTPKPDFWVRRYIRLTQALPSKWHAYLPARFGELGWNVAGHQINRWTSVNQERISAMSIAGITHYLEQQDRARILEIGGGAGEMGYTLSKALPHSTWYDCDLLGCLIYSAIQLAINLPDKRHYIYVGNLKLSGQIDESLIIRSAEKASQCENAIVYIPHFLIDDFKGCLKLHFAYNTYSFGEMPKAAVTHYTQLLAGFLKDDGILFDQNGYFPERGGDKAEDIIAAQFKLLAWPRQFNGKWLPNGPTRIWCNNQIGSEIQALVTRGQINKVIKSLQDQHDVVDIQYPNELLWPKVYELFSSPQRLNELYPW